MEGREQVLRETHRLAWQQHTSDVKGHIQHLIPAWGPESAAWARAPASADTAIGSHDVSLTISSTSRVPVTVHCPHLADQKTETQRGQMTYLPKVL